jgi:hypothetical protein
MGHPNLDVGHPSQDRIGSKSSPPRLAVFMSFTLSLKMGTAFKPINLIVDSIGMFFSALAWISIIWAPVLLLGIFIYLRHAKPGIVYLLFLGFLAAICVIAGLVLKWLALGIVRRKRVRVVFSMLVFVSWGLFLGRAALLHKDEHTFILLSNSLQAIALVSMGCVTGLALTKGANTLDEQDKGSEGRA